MLPLIVPEFTVTALDGTAMKSAQIPIQHQWLLIYVTPNCRACEKLLNLIDNKNDMGLPTKVVVVNGRADSKQSAKVAQKFPDLRGASWYADPTADAFKKLELRGAPMIVGLRQNVVMWKMAGLLNGDTEKVRSIMNSWCRDRHVPRNAGRHVTPN